MLSIYTHVAQTEEEKEEWIRKPALMVLIYEAVVAQVLDYALAPSAIGTATGARFSGS